MKLRKLLLIFITCSMAAFAQQKSVSVKLYDSGNAFFAKQDYRAADSLFSLSLKYERHPDTYFNRAVCRRQLNDFEGYCLDLNSASELYDAEATRLYWKQCAKKDTVYKKTNGEPATKLNFETVEYIISNRFDTDFDYEKLDTAKVPIISKIRKNNEVIYRSCLDVSDPVYKGGMDSLVSYIKMNSEFTKIVMDNKLLGVIAISMVIDENGKVKSVKIKDHETDKAMEELLKIISNSPGWQPANYNGRPVKFQALFFVTYYDHELTIQDQNFYIKKMEWWKLCLSSKEEWLPWGHLFKNTWFILKWQKKRVYPVNAI